MIGDIVRRVVVGENADGRSVIVRDDGVAAKRLAGIDLFPLWGIDAIPVKLPCSGLENAGSWAGEGVVRAAVGTIAAGVLVGKDDSAHLHFDEHGFHRTDSVDVAFIVSGEVTMRVPGEADVILRPGDTVVQNGATHAWENQGDQQAVILWLWVKGQRNSRPHEPD